MKRKQSIVLALIISLIFIFAACAPAAPSQSSETTAAPTATEAPTEAPAEAADTKAEESSAASTEASKADSKTEEKGAVTVVEGSLEDTIKDLDFERPTLQFKLSAEEEEARKKEPAYGKTFTYWLSDFCTSGPAVADALGFYRQAGLDAQAVKGTSYTEALGTHSVDLAVGHIATMLVPMTNGVDAIFVGGAHVGCKSIYVLADSGINSTADLKGQKISCPNGIGASDYNITACLLDSDGINPLKDVELVQVENAASVPAMQNGEIAAALLSDNYAYDMVKDGTLKRIRSLLDDDWKTTPCCAIAMNRTFVEENPLTAKLAAACVKEALNYMGAHPDITTKMLLKLELNTGDYEKNLEINTSLDFGLSDEEAETGLKKISDAYIRLGIITAFDKTEDVMDRAFISLE